MNPSQKQTKRKRNLLIATGVIVALAVVIALNFKNLKYFFDFAFKANHFGKGDKVYFSKDFPEKRVGSWAAYRLIKPADVADIDTMLLTDEKKRYFKSKIDPEQKPYLAEFDSHFDLKDMRQRKSLFMGTYFATHWLPVMYNGKLESAIFYSIIPDRKVYHETLPGFGSITNENMPDNYIFADEQVYVGPFFLADKE